MPWPKGKKRSDEDRQKMREGQARNPWSEEKRKQASASRKGRHHTEEAKAKMSAALLGNHNTAGMKRTAKDKAQIAARMKGNQHSKGKTHPEESRARHVAVSLQNFHGGRAAAEYAEVLCPAGFVREHHVMWGTACNDRFRLDFAHVEAKVNIELDGPSHAKTKDMDELRDKLLKSMGWRIIRIRL